ncbi:hypothetical protein BKA67DRAFT_538437 [Truncatella angustata]|uniref:Uncharacterized protein n=1 Tax=Truncatella angustata TaxID=152316 RepID=A0A9P8ZUP6_9PEZI|nr:uncharacterized protein BKA67DRAFT_538437 [Truncatella angustata]KAH6648398.1 hypothetical protein BKA67DRAFT_538437 [Truncatella angustata]KAH8204835.1 hypothetical protein TruAng_001024 [Truncatella angustata]
MRSILRAVSSLLLLSSTGVMAPGPGQLTPPGNPGGHSFLISKLTTTIMQVAHFGRNSGILDPDGIIANPKAIEEYFELAKGAVGICLDDVVHGDEPLRIEIGKPGKDFIDIPNAPASCVAIIKVATGYLRGQGAEETSMVSLVPGNDRGLRIQGVKASQMEALREMAEDKDLGTDGEHGVEIYIV